MNFYKGRVLRIDLSSARATVEPLNMDWVGKYVGGKGLLLRYLWEEVPPGVDPLSPENPVILMTGPIAGTTISTGSRLVVGAKSPVTGILNDSYVGGSFSPELKFAGYDAVIIKGESPEPVVVTIRDDEVSFVPALPRYWGLKNSEILAALRADFDEEAKVLAIGPAGENVLPQANLSTDQYHKAGRGGHGALWGHKKLKAIAVRGTGSVSVGDARAFLAELYRMHKEYVLTDDNLWAYEEGTPALVQVMSDAGVIPTRNWSTGSFEGVENINSEALQRVRTKNRACYQCSIACRQFHELGDVKAEGPEYETIALCGANCGIDDLEALMRFNHECDEWGIDTMSTGSVLALAMDLTEKGVEDFGVRFGEVESYLKVPELLAKREGIGARLALGARALAQECGHPEMAMEVKNLEVSGYDPRGAFGMALTYATSDRGGCHMRTYPLTDEVITGNADPQTLDGKAQMVISGDPGEGAIGENCSAVKFSGIWCDFWALSPAQIGEVFSLVFDREVTADEVWRIGERIWNLGRLFNLREGVEADDAPEKFYKAEYAHTTGPSAGRAIGVERFRAALREFYELRGWDENGVPTEERLAELDVDVRL